MPLLDERATELIERYNRDPAGQKYNEIASKVYEARRTFGDSLEFESYILNGLIGFDMGRTMKGGSAAFASRLRCCLEAARKNASFDELRNRRLSSTDFVAIRPVIVSVYDCLAAPGTLHPKNSSHV